MARLWKVFLSFPLLLLPASALAQPRFLPADPSAPTLQALTRNSGYIFSGTVTNVERIASNGADQVSVMRITFRVDRAVRGVHSGQLLVIREWAGLWQAGERYRRGERVFLFLYPPSKLGLTSPVSGSTGRFAVERDGAIVLPPQAGGLGGATGNPSMAEGRRVNPRELTRIIRRAERERP